MMMDNEDASCKEVGGCVSAARASQNALWG